MSLPGRGLLAEGYCSVVVSGLLFVAQLPHIVSGFQLTLHSACFYGGTFPPAQRDRGCELLCRQDWYDFTTACFTCIVENGGEIEGGGVAFIGKPTNDEDLLMDNAEYADAAMRNITELCEANFTAVATPVETFTATPTTT